MTTIKIPKVKASAFAATNETIDHSHATTSWMNLNSRIMSQNLVLPENQMQLAKDFRKDQPFWRKALIISDIAGIFVGPDSRKSLADCSFDHVSR